MGFPTIMNKNLIVVGWSLQSLGRSALLLRVAQGSDQNTYHFDVFSVLLILVLAIRFPDRGVPASSPTTILKKESSSEYSKLVGRINKLGGSDNVLTDTHEISFLNQGEVWDYILNRWLPRTKLCAMVLPCTSEKRAILDHFLLNPFILSLCSFILFTVPD